MCSAAGSTRCHNELIPLLLGRQHCSGHRAHHRAYPTIKTELTVRCTIVYGCAGNVSDCGEHGKQDGQIERRAGFGEISWCQIYRNARQHIIDPKRTHRTEHALAKLNRIRLTETDNGEPRQTTFNGSFHNNRNCCRAKKCACICRSDHERRLRVRM